MGVVELVAGLSSFATLQTWISQQRKDFSNKNNSENLEYIDLEIKNKIEKCFNTEYEITKLDEFITNHSSNYKNSYGPHLFFNEEEKEELISLFIRENPNLNNENSMKILDEYFYLLNKYLEESLSMDTKFLKKTIDNQTEKIVKSVIQVVGENKEENVFSNSVYSEKIIKVSNSINIILLNSELDINMLKRSFQLDYLKAENLEDVIFRMINLLGSFDSYSMNKISGINSENSLESLFNLIVRIAPDLSIELNQYYNHAIKQTINCIYGFSDKNPEFLISIGALGLANDYSDEKIYLTIMNNVYRYFSKVNDILKEYFKNRDFSELEKGTVDEIHKNLFYQIRHMFNDDNKEILKLIYERDEMIDVEIANELSISIYEVRKNLYLSTKVFLYYKFVDNYSTKITIIKIYKEVIKKYYSELLGDDLNEG